jgi:hypothetical protein
MNVEETKRDELYKETDMAKTFNLQEAEKRVFRLATFEDGIWEIFLGSTFFLMSFYALTREFLGPVINAILILGVIFALVGLAWFAKKALVLPRVGMVKFGKRTVRKIRTANLITWGLVILTFALMIMGSKNILQEPVWQKLPQWVSDFDVDLFFALIIIAFFGVIAYSMDVPRFYIHGTLIGIANFTSAVMHVYYEVLYQWPVALAGSWIIAAGIYILLKFLKKYPIPKEIENA